MASLPTQHGRWIYVAAILMGASLSANATTTIDTSNPTDWKISNGLLAVDWLPGIGRIVSMHWSSFPDQELIDQTNRDRNGPKGFYMDNVAPAPARRPTTSTWT